MTEPDLDYIETKIVAELTVARGQLGDITVMLREIGVKLNDVLQHINVLEEDWRQVRSEMETARLAKREGEAIAALSQYTDPKTSPEQPPIVAESPPKTGPDSSDQ